MKIIDRLGWGGTMLRLESWPELVVRIATWWPFASRNVSSFRIVVDTPSITQEHAVWMRTRICYFLIFAYLFLCIHLDSVALKIPFICERGEPNLIIFNVFIDFRYDLYIA